MNDDDDLVRIEVKLTDKCWKILLTVTSFNDEESDSWLTDTVLLEIKVFFFSSGYQWNTEGKLKRITEGNGINCCWKNTLIIVVKLLFRSMRSKVCGDYSFFFFFLGRRGRGSSERY